MSPSPQQTSTVALNRFPADLPWMALLLIAAYGPVLAALTHEWQANEEMGHGPFVPLFAGYVIWERRRQLSHAGDSSRCGLLLMLAGGLQLLIATLGAELFFQRIALLVSTAG